MKAMGCSFQSSFKFSREICQLPPKHAHDFVYTPKAVNIMLFRKKSLQVWPNQGTYPRKMPPHASSGRERVTGPTKPQEERQWCSQPHPRNSKEFFPKLEEPKVLPCCPKENATLLPHDSKLLASCGKRMKSSNFKISMWYLSGAVPGWYDMVGTRVRMMWAVAIAAPIATSIYSCLCPAFYLNVFF